MEILGSRVSLYLSLFLQNKILLSLILFKESGRKVVALTKRVATRQFKNQDPGFADSFLTTNIDIPPFVQFYKKFYFPFPANEITLF